MSRFEFGEQLVSIDLGSDIGVHSQHPTGSFSRYLDVIDQTHCCDNCTNYRNGNLNNDLKRALLHGVNKGSRVGDCLAS